eukprot:402619-Prymnesium_polylepis.1
MDAVLHGVRQQSGRDRNVAPLRAAGAVRPRERQLAAGGCSRGGVPLEHPSGRGGNEAPRLAECGCRRRRRSSAEAGECEAGDGLVASSEHVVKVDRGTVRKIRERQPHELARLARICGHRAARAREGQLNEPERQSGCQASRRAGQRARTI